MSDETIGTLANRLADYVHHCGLDSITVLLHGGEPLLAGPQRVKNFLETITASLNRSGCAVEFAMQTNGVLLNGEWLDLFDKWDLTFGISLDGDRLANDRWRLDQGGKSSYEEVLRGIHLAQGTETGRRLFRGFLSVIDVRNDPINTYRALSAFSPPRLDFLFPEATHENPPPLAGAENREGTVYADWLIAIFDDWFQHSTNIRIRLFENLIDLVLGGRSQTEGTGEGHLNLLTIETDGDIEDVDLMKAAYEGAGTLQGEDGNKATVFTHSFSELATAAPFLERHRLHTFDGLSETCRTCRVMPACGGGPLAHRWSNARGFNNPSVYCRDLFKLIAHIEVAVTNELQSFLGDRVIKKGFAPA
jgi:uncharacterized protein